MNTCIEGKPPQIRGKTPPLPASHSFIILQPLQLVLLAAPSEPRARIGARSGVWLRVLQSGYVVGVRCSFAVLVRVAWAAGVGRRERRAITAGLRFSSHGGPPAVSRVRMDLPSTVASISTVEGPAPYAGHGTPWPCKEAGGVADPGWQSRGQLPISASLPDS